MNATPTERETIRRYRVSGKPRQRGTTRWLLIIVSLLAVTLLIEVISVGQALAALIMLIIFAAVAHTIYLFLGQVYEIDVLAHGEMIFRSYLFEITLAPSQITRIIGTLPLWRSYNRYFSTWMYARFGLQRHLPSLATVQYTSHGEPRQLSIDSYLEGIYAFIAELKAANPALVVKDLGSQSTHERLP